MAVKRDWIGLVLTLIACALTLYIISNAREYPMPEGFLAGAPGPGLATPPTSLKCRVTSLNVDTATSIYQEGGKTWLCDSTAEAGKLIQGAKVATGYAPYLARNDAVCIDQTGEGTIFTCLDLSIPINDDTTPDIGYQGHLTACANYEKKYYDLSGALTTLMAMKASIQSNSTQLTSSFTTLDTMYSTYKCDSITDTSKKIICNAITQTKYLIGQNRDKATSLESILMPAIQPALDSRTNLLNTLKEYKCDFKLPNA